ncbi:MAG: 4-alpha-glucanotransferase [bacterium]|nr:4-alpha-glucanotransferase [bacterium]
MRYNYDFLYQKYTKNLWEKIGVKRRSGVMCPLFSIYSKESIGIGEFADLLPVIDWLKETGHSILQLLPLNEAGYGNSPYSAFSSFAMDPVYLRLSEIDDDSSLRAKYPIGSNSSHVNYEVRADKLELLKEFFKNADLNDPQYLQFKQENNYWLTDYSTYKLNKETKVNPLASAELMNPNFYEWIQFHAFTQMSQVSRYARECEIKIMGDIPFLVSADSADVLGQYQEVFNFDKVAGCPPDAYNARGQKWGMPTYNWQKLRETNYQYFKDKLCYAANFFDMYRIDHVAGIFRLWSIDANACSDDGGLYGNFDPLDEKDWQENGGNILKAMIDVTEMMPCAEDLGVVPDQCRVTLKKLGVMGLDVTRWLKDRTEEPRRFIRPEHFRKTACAISSGHDMSNTLAMWLYEINTTDEWCFKKNCHDKGLDFEQVGPKLFDLENSKFGRLRWKEDVKSEDILLWNLGLPKREAWEFLDAFYETHDEERLLFRDIKKNNREIIYDLLEYTSEAASIFCLNSILDLMLLEKDVVDIWGFRVNFPGSVGEHNWSIRMPYKVEEFAGLKANKRILHLNKNTDRA